MNKQYLIDFEKMIADKWDAGLIKYPVHLSGGNEDELIEIFKNIHKNDWVFSTHRSHYHYLLKASMLYGKKQSEFRLIDMIMQGRSMHIMDKDCNFFATGIVAGACAIAVGVAKAIKENNWNKSFGIPGQVGSGNEGQSDFRKVWCFVGDGATDEGHFYEAVKYSIEQNLPSTFIVEDNDRSVCTRVKDRCGKQRTYVYGIGEKVKHYEYKPTYPHVGTGKTIKFSDMGEVKGTL